MTSSSVISTSTVDITSPNFAQSALWPQETLPVASPKPVVTALPDQRTFEPTPQCELWRQTSSGLRARFLSEMDAVIPWTDLLALLAPHYPHHVIGRPRKHLEFVLRCHLISLFYNLAGEGLTDALNDSEAFKRFIRLGQLEPDVPEETTLRNLRYIIEKNNLACEILRVVNESLTSRGLKMSQGTLVDATIVEASPSTKNKAQKRDPDMDSTKKNNNWYFGLKIHTGEDAEANVTHSVEVTAANESDVGQTPKLDLLRDYNSRMTIPFDATLKWLGCSGGSSTDLLPEG
jgi:hypothetical protein